MSVWGSKGINDCVESTVDGTATYPYVLGVRGNNGFVGVDHVGAKKKAVLGQRGCPRKRCDRYGDQVPQWMKERLMGHC